MNEKEHAFILKKLMPGEHKFSVLAQSRGKLIIVVSDLKCMKNIGVGSCINFMISNQKNNIQAVYDINLISAYSPKAFVDLIWIHHLLEICYYFLPLHQISYDSFNLISKCYMLLSIHTFFGNVWELIKRICVGILFISVGFYPSNLLCVPLISFKQALLQFVDFDSMENIELIRKNVSTICSVTQKNLDLWLLECIKTHSRIGSFKTLQFMYDIPLSSIIEG